MTLSVNKPAFLRKYPGTLVLLILLAVLTYAGEVLTPSLLGDEWGILGRYIHQSGPSCPKLAITARLFEGCWMPIVYRVVGLNPQAFHTAGMLVTLTSALMLLVALDIMLPDWPAYNGAVAITFLVIPADMARLWLAGHIVFTTMLLLLAVCFMALFWRDGSRRAWLAGMIAIGLSLNYYESTVGVIIALSTLGFLFGRHLSRRQRLAFLAPGAVAVLFSVWRWRWQTIVGAAYGHSTGNVTFAPGDLLERLLFGADYTLRKSWSDAMLDWLQTRPRGAGVGPVGETVLLAVVVLLPMLAVYGLTRAARPPAPMETVREVRNRKRDLARAAAIGIVVVVAGYFPVILASFPDSYYTESRFHNLPTIGAALVLCAGLFAMSLLLGRTPSRARMIAVAGLAPLVALGIAGHLTTQRNINQAWADQQMIWRSLFIQAPDFTDDTYVLFMLTGYDSPSKGPHPFVSGSWGTTHAIQLLYGNPELRAGFVYADPTQSLDIQGSKLVLDYYYGVWEYPAEETVVFVFDEAKRQLVRLNQLERGGKVLPLGAGRIIETPAAATEYRRLVSGK